jgi:hypothetical protein
VQSTFAQCSTKPDLAKQIQLKFFEESCFREREPTAFEAYAKLKESLANPISKGGRLKKWHLKKDVYRLFGDKKTLVLVKGVKRY